MRSFHSGRTFTGVLLGTLLAAQAAASPLHGVHRELTQPDGSQVEVVLWGDEYYIRAETPNGYALVLDPDTHFISYAVESPDGDLVSSGVVYDGVAGHDALASLGLVPGARRSKAMREAIAAGVRAQLNPEVGVATQRASQVSTELDVKLPAPPASAPKGAVTGLVVLVDFPDRKSTIPVTEVENAFNSTGTYGTTWHGSIRNWSEQISGNITSVQHQVVGFYTAKYDVAHYNAPTAEWDYSTADELYKEVYAYIDANVDLTNYAVNGALPSLAVVYAGNTIARGWAMALWPHGGCGGRYKTSEGVNITQCFMTDMGTRTPLDLETFRHELGHSFFHWPDTYDYDDDSMGAGGFATETDIPCAPFRMWAGWIKPVDVTSVPGVYSLQANGDSCLRYNNSSNTKEYFIAEYAKKSPRRSPPDQGLLIWHIDESGDNSWQDMTATRHYMMSVEQADGKFDLEHNIRAGSGDLFRAGYKDKFDETTTPNSKWWNAANSGFKLCNIGDVTTDTMTVNAGCITAGGTSSTGGASGSGGTRATGGTMSGAGRASAVGGSAALGGSATGALTTAGGRTGSSGGRSSTLGNAGIGSAYFGGAKSSGGSLSSGGRSLDIGTQSTGGSNATGGLASAGGKSGSVGPASGGSQSLGGTSATGDARTVTGGSGSGTESSPNRNNGGAGLGNGTGGAIIRGGASTVLPASSEPMNSGQDDADGCNCQVTGRPPAAGWARLGMLGMLVLGLRRRFSRRRRPASNA
jgi:M6 family metalloprotease-like protein/MYXO-CTERM domain-containing protein